MPLSDVTPQKNKWLCEQWAKAVVELNKAFDMAFGDLRDHIDEIARTSPQSAIEVVNSDDLDALIGHITDLADDEHLSEVKEEVHKLAAQLRSVPDVAVKFARGVTGSRETVMAAVRREFPGLERWQIVEVERRLYPAAAAV